MKKSILSILLISALLITINACTDLTEETFSTVTAENFFQTEQQFISALGDAYNQMATPIGGHNNIFSINEVSTDEMLIAQKGADWFDGGVWLTMHRHTFQSDNQPINNAWNFAFGGVNACNRLIFQFEDLRDSGNADEELANQFIAELSVLRAFYYYLLLDNFGNVPIVTSFEIEGSPANNTDFQAGRTEVFNFIEQEILDNIDLISDEVGQATYGRVNKFVAHMILAKLYLNAEVYTGESMWEEAVEQTDAIINSNNYSLAGNYGDNFATQNSNSPEFIFAIPFDQVFLTGHNTAQMTLLGPSQQTFDLQDQPWNGYATMEDFYNSYQDEDIRKEENFITGLQRDLEGNVLLDPQATELDPDGPPLNYTPSINSLNPNSLRQAGARVGKYDFEVGATPNLNNDKPIFRYADVLLMKAEALFRQNPGDPVALSLVNQIRNRAGLAGYSNLTEQRLLDERGREFFFEMLRRQDLIRFNGGLHFVRNDDGSFGEQYPAGETAFNDGWLFKTTADDNGDGVINEEDGIDASESFRNVFPIPRPQLDANPNLNQNPGYTAQ